MPGMQLQLPMPMPMQPGEPGEPRVGRPYGSSLSGEKVKFQGHKGNAWQIFHMVRLVSGTDDCCANLIFSEVT